MITQVEQIIKSHELLEKPVSLQKLYDEKSKSFFALGNVVQMPCNGDQETIGQAHRIKNGELEEHLFVKDGHYERNLTHVFVMKKGGHEEYRFYTETLLIQRIRSKSGHCHALLHDFIIPYAPFTYDAALAILDMFGKSGESVESFCDGDLHGLDLSPKLLKKLIAWSNMYFAQLGISLSPEAEKPDEEKKDTAAELCTAVAFIWKNFREIFIRTIQLLKKTLFQDRDPVCSPYLTGLPTQGLRHPNR